MAKDKAPPKAKAQKAKAKEGGSVEKKAAVSLIPLSFEEAVDGLLQVRAEPDQSKKKD